MPLWGSNLLVSFTDMQKDALASAWRLTCASEKMNVLFFVKRPFPACILAQLLIATHTWPRHATSQLMCRTFQSALNLIHYTVQGSPMRCS